MVAYFSRIGNASLPDNVDTISSASLNNTDNGVQGNMSNPYELECMQNKIVQLEDLILSQLEEIISLRLENKSLREFIRRQELED